MNKEVYNIINSLRDNTDHYTHASMLQPTTGKFLINREVTEEFWEVYCSQLFEKKGEFVCGLQERYREFMPILGDVDIAIPYDEDVPFPDRHVYTEEQVRKLVAIFIDVLKYVIQEEYDTEHLYCFVLEKKLPYQSGSRIKNGFHIHFPFLYMSNPEQEMQLIPHINKRIEDDKVFESITKDLSGEVILETKSTKKPWLMYGSRKELKMEAYMLTTIYDHKCNPVSLERVMRQNRIYNTDEDVITFSNPIEFYLPRILSLHPFGRELYTIKPSIRVLPKERLSKAVEVKRVYENISVTQALEIAKKLLPIIRRSRSDNYDEWLEMGWILYNIGDGCVEAFDLWVDFSRQTTRNNFSEAVCMYRWKSMSVRNYTIGTLRFYARDDNPELYEKFHLEEQRALINSSLGGGHYDIAKILYDKYSTQFVCADLKQDLWYEFRGHRWVPVQQGWSLKSKIALEIIPIYMEEMNKMSLQAIREDADGEKAMSKQKQIFKAIGNMKSNNFKTAVMKECKDLFYREDFLRNLDSNAYIFGCNNGVIDLHTGEFRAGKPEDFISMSCGFDYRDFEEDEPEVLECKDLLLKIFVDADLRRYFIEYAGKLLKSGNNEKVILIMSGVGDNGKSVLMNLVKKTLGEYFAIPPTTLLTAKEAESSSARPELAMTRKKKICVFNEPGGKDTFNPGPLKRYSGDEDVNYRDLYQASGEMEVTFKMVIVCNKLPRLEAEDQAVWNRIRVLPFESRFPKDPSEVPDSEEEQIRKKIFPRDNKFNEKIPFMKQAFLWILLQSYKHIQKHGSSLDPEKVTETCINYRKNNDVFLQFVSEKMKEDDSAANEGITVSEVWAIFKSWYNESFSGVKPPNKSELKDDLINRWGPPRGNKWKYYREKTDRDLEEEGDILIVRPTDRIPTPKISL